MHALVEQTPASDSRPAPASDTPQVAAPAASTPDAVAPKAGRRAARPAVAVVYLVVATVLAFGGGMAATIAYDRLVSVPSLDMLARQSVHPPWLESGGADAGPLDLTPIVPLDPNDQRRLDVQAAIAALRPSLPAYAQIDLEIRVDEEIVFLVGDVDTRLTLDAILSAVGAVAGVRAVDSRRVEIVSRVHVIGPGDTLSELALRYYGSSSAWHRIIEANPGLTARNVQLGQKVLIAPIKRAPDWACPVGPAGRAAAGGGRDRPTTP